MSALERARERLDAIRAENRYRRVQPDGVAGALDFSSNDYLALATDPQVVQAFARAKRVGSGGARLLGGRHREHWLLEEELAAWLGRERALLFSSGYLAAAGAVPVLGSLVESIVADEYVHASLIDGIRLARVPRTVYPHGILPAREARSPASLIVTESIFSMDGDTANLGRYVTDLTEADLLLVDEAHALGVAGPEGAGLAVDLRDERVLVLGTLSKALGGAGGFIAGSAAAIDLLANCARTFVFDTAPPPALALAARIALVLARRADDRRERLHANVARLRSGLRELGVPTVEGPSPIVPVLLGSEERALDVARRLLERRIVAPAIRPPTVPPGGSRLRLSVRCDHTAADVDRVLLELQACIATS